MRCARTLRLVRPTATRGLWLRSSAASPHSFAVGDIQFAQKLRADEAKPTSFIETGGGKPGVAPQQDCAQLDHAPLGIAKHGRTNPPPPPLLGGGHPAKSPTGLALKCFGEHRDATDQLVIAGCRQVKGVRQLIFRVLRCGIRQPEAKDLVT